VDDLRDPRCGALRRLVFPDADHPPSEGTKARVRIAITLAIPEQLLFPPRRIHLWPRRVFRTHVPETRIDEDSNAGAAKDDVATATNTFQGQWGVDSKPKSEPVKLPPDG
jgi:hypothetical protein